MKTPRIPKLFLHASAATALAFASANAADFYPITDIAAPNMIEGAPDTNPLTNVIEGPGVGYEAAEPHNRLGGTYYTTDPGGFPSDYIASNPGDEEIILDLGVDSLLHGQGKAWEPLECSPAIFTFYSSAAL